MTETPYDYTGDGVADAMEVTGGPSDGYAHATMVDADQNGIYEAVHVDVDGDTQAEMTLIDANQDNRIELAQVDQNGNQAADLYVHDTNGDGVLDTRVNDVNENGLDDAAEGGASTPAPAPATSGVPSPSQLEALIVLNQGRLISLYEQILNTPVDPNDTLAVENKAAALQRVADAVAGEQGRTARIINDM